MPSIPTPASRMTVLQKQEVKKWGRYTSLPSPLAEAIPSACNVPFLFSLKLTLRDSSNLFLASLTLHTLSQWEMSMCLSTDRLFRVTVLLIMCACAKHSYVTAPEVRGQLAGVGSLLLPVLGIELRSSGLAAGAFTHTILPEPEPNSCTACPFSLISIKLLWLPQLSLYSSSSGFWQEEQFRCHGKPNQIKSNSDLLTEARNQ